MPLKGVERPFLLAPRYQDLGAGAHAAFEVEDLDVGFEESARGQITLGTAQVEVGQRKVLAGK